MISTKQTQSSKRSTGIFTYKTFDIKSHFSPLV